MDILLTINENQVYNACILISSLRRHTNINETLNFYVMHNSLAESHILSLSNSGENIIINPIYIDINSILSNKENLFPIDYTLYARIFAYKFLPSSLNRILYLNYDTIIINDVSSFYNMDFKDKALIGCEFPLKPKTASKKKYLSLTSKDYYIDTGVMLMNLSFMREFDFSPKIISFLESFDNAGRPDEQSVVNLFYKDFIKNLNYLIYNLGQSSLDFFNIKGAFINQHISMKTIRENACILHFHDEVKPWMDSCNYSLKGLFIEEENYYIKNHK